MLEENDQATLTDLNNKNDIKVEVNFSKDKDVVKMIMDGKEAVVSMKELYNLVWTIADPEWQEKLMPVRQTTVRKIRKVHVVKVTKNIKKGQMLKVRCETNVPVEVWEGLKGMIYKKPVSAGGIPIIRVK